MRLSLPIQLLGLIAFVLLCGDLFSEEMVRVFYTISTVFKDMLAFMLPWIVFSFVATGIMSFKKNAPLVLLILLVMIFCSNGIAAFLSYSVIVNVLSYVTCQLDGAVLMVSRNLQPYGVWMVAPLIRSEYALVMAVIMGLIGSFFSLPVLTRSTGALKKGIEYVLNYFFIPLLPLYVLGFLLKMRFEGSLLELMRQYGTVVILIAAVQLIYLFWMYLLAAGFSVTTASAYISRAIPSYLTAFSTMSSTATIPVSVLAATSNTGNRSLATMAMPIMANVHLLGDSIGTPVLAIATLVLFKGCLPDLSSYLAFLSYFCVSMFAVSGIPGGGILVMIPILKSAFGFTPDMISIITALYLLLDSFGTAANVMGDGALVILLDKLLRRLRIQ